MSARPDAEADRLTVVLDIRHPFSYLALRPSFALAEETGVEIEWLPVRAHTLAAPSDPSPDDDRGSRHRRARAQMIAREIQVYSEAQGLGIQAPYRDGSARAFHLAWLWLREAAANRLRPFLEEAFRAYWAEDLDPESEDDIAALLRALGLDLTRFHRWSASDGTAALRSVESRLTASGVFQAPAYILADEVFYGRQHLPMIRWILDGRSGERPI